MSRVNGGHNSRGQQHGPHRVRGDARQDRVDEDNPPGCAKEQRLLACQIFVNLGDEGGER